MSKRTQLEDALAFQIQLAKLPKPEREFIFARPRRWRFDFAFVAQKLAVEVDGGLFIGGRHNRGLGMLADMEKMAAAMLLGWSVLRVGEPHVKSGQALEWIEGLLEAKAA